MADERFLAHISEDGQRRETVAQHLLEVAEMSADFAQAFHGEKEAYLVGMYHDIGKYSDAFQKHLCAGGGRVDHSTAGAKELFARKDPLGALAVAGHHGGLPDFGCRIDSEEAVTLLGRCKRKLEDYSAFQKEVSILRGEYPDYIARNPDGFSQAFFTRMLFSCLVDADFLCTERFMTNGKVERSGYDSIPELRSRFEEYAAIHWSRADTELNRERLRIRKHCESMAAHAPGLFQMTIPTGGGKTAASMAFALQHAEIFGKTRIIYVIPYTSIIEQNSDVFAAALGDENVLQHHSNVEIPEEETAESLKKRLSAENWDAPVIMTTAVQFLESLFASKPSKCRKLHNIANSVVIFDEAQMMPVSYLRPCMAAISQLVKNYGVTAVMCTATQPALGEILKEFLSGCAAVELAPKDMNLDVFQRVAYTDAGTLSEEQLLSGLQGEDQVLCVVNTRAEAERIYSSLPGDGNFHLSTRMTPNHRRRILRIVRDRLRSGEHCRLISTSLIEAGVDVDFPVVYRQIAGIDSIVQAAGRCNREGKLARPGKVYIFRTDGKIPRLQERNISAGDSILKTMLPDHPQAIERYFRKVYTLAGKDGMDSRKIIPSLREGIAGCMLPIRTVSERFKLITEDTCTVYIPRKENRELLTALRSGSRSRRIMRKAGQDAVSVYRTQFTALKEAGKLEMLEADAAILLNPEENYSEETGIIAAAVGGDAIFC